MVVQINNVVHRCMRTLRTWTPNLRAADVPVRADHALPREAALPPMLHYPQTTLSGVLEQSAARFGASDAVIYEETRWSYATLCADVRRLAAGFAVLGVRPGDRVMMALPNCPEFILVFMAAQTMGAVVVNAGPLMGMSDLRQLRALTMPRVLVGLDLQASMLDTLGADDDRLQRISVSLKDYQRIWKRLVYRAKLHQVQSKDVSHRLKRQEGFTPLEELMATAPSRPPTVAPDPEATAVLQPTGGTGGTLKVVQLSHRNLTANAMQLTVWQNVRPAVERVLSVLPMFHVYGLSTCLTTSLFNAATIIPMTRFNVNHLVRMIVAHRPTILPLAPAIIEPLCAKLESLPEATQYEVAQILAPSTVTSGAAPLLPAVAERFESLTGSSIVQGYGLTEASPVTHANPPHAVRPGTIGMPLPDTRVRITALGDPTSPAMAGEPGEMMVAGPQVMQGYLDNPEENQRVLYRDADGTTWLRTGDVVRIDAEGYTTIVDRRKDMINCGGFKVFPAKVERILAEHESVREAAVVGRVDPKKTQRVVAVVVLEDAVLQADVVVEALRSHCRRNLAPYEVPHTIEFAKALPRTPLGKLQRFRLEDSAAEAAKTREPSEDA